MTPEEKLAALRAEALALKAKANGADFTDGDAERALEVTREIGEVEAVIARKAAAAQALGSIAAAEPVQDSAEDAPASATTVKARTLGEAFTQSAAMKAFRKAYPGGPSSGTPIDIRVKGLGTSKVLNTEDTGNAAPVRQSGIDDLVYRPERRLLDVITRGTTDVPYVEYRQVITKTNASKIVPEYGTVLIEDGEDAGKIDAEASLKPLSTLTTTTAEAKAHTYADGMEVTVQELADDGIISTLIDSTLRENLEITLENILLNGDSAEGEPNGILNTSGVLQQGYSTDIVTTVRKAITKLQTTSGATIRGVLLNPSDDEAWDLFKDADGRYFSGGPFGSGPKTAWGFERIVCPVIQPGQAIIGDFSTIHLLDYTPLEIAAFNQHEDYARKNLVYIRAELRAMQMIRNAARLCVVELTP